jgi:hypothetical protein
VLDYFSRGNDMANSIEGQDVELWFSYLRDLQSACSINTSVKSMDLLKFANSKITTILPSANDQNQFIIEVKQSPGFDLALGDLTTYSTFEALLDHFNPLPTYLGMLLQTIAAAPYPSGGVADFLNAQISSAFPGGKNGNAWTNAVGLLGSVIPSICFSSTLQSAVATSVDDPAKKVSDLVNQIAVLG